MMKLCPTYPLICHTLELPHLTLVQANEILGSYWYCCLAREKFPGFGHHNFLTHGAFKVSHGFSKFQVVSRLCFSPLLSSCRLGCFLPSQQTRNCSLRMGFLVGLRRGKPRLQNFSDFLRLPGFSTQQMENCFRLEISVLCFRVSSQFQMFLAQFHVRNAIRNFKTQLNSFGFWSFSDSDLHEFHAWRSLGFCLKSMQCALSPHSPHGSHSPHAQSLFIF